MNTQQPAHQHLYAEELLRYFITTDETLSTLILCNPQQIALVTSDKDLYEALGSIQPEDPFPLNKLTKLLETIHIQHQHKQVLTHPRVEELRKKALR
ncbi:MAG TPA: hypothetical protein VJG90_00665 [Candidatus Nanoarchaeia archaeon]|nr:hypothetical protein [Candidatus Nanoarchaeia archaeon]